MRTRKSPAERFAENIAEGVRRGGLLGGAPDEVGSGGESGADDSSVDDGGGASVDPPKTDAELEAARKELERYKKDEEKRRKEDERRKRDAQAEKDKKAAEEGRAKEVLEKREQELEETRKQLEAYQEATRGRAQEIFDGLPEASRAKLQDFAEELSDRAWLKLVEKERDSVVALSGEPAKKKVPDASPGGKPPAEGRGKSHEIMDATKDRLRHLGHGHLANSLDGLNLYDDGRGNVEFGFGDTKGGQSSLDGVLKWIERTTEHVGPDGRITTVRSKGNG